jgi:hypothetical protein
MPASYLPSKKRSNSFFGWSAAMMMARSSTLGLRSPLPTGGPAGSPRRSTAQLMRPSLKAGIPRIIDSGLPRVRSARVRPLRGGPEYDGVVVVWPIPEPDNVRRTRLERPRRSVADTFPWARGGFLFEVPPVRTQSKYNWAEPCCTRFASDTVKLSNMAPALAAPGWPKLSRRS